MIADVLVIAGLVIVTIAVYGVVRLPTAGDQLHAASKAAFLGVVLLLGASALSAGLEAAGRALLLTCLLTVTAPVAAHAVAGLICRDGEEGDD